MTVSLQGLPRGQMYYCKAAATNTDSARCINPVVGDVKMYLIIVTTLLPIVPPSTCKCIVDNDAGVA